jgi:hypothetical protein
MSILKLDKIKYKKYRGNTNIASPDIPNFSSRLIGIDTGRASSLNTRVNDYILSSRSDYKNNS